MIILGVDPGLLHTGWGVIEAQGSRMRARAYGCIDTKSGDAIGVRLQAIHQGIAEVIETYHPDECALEDVFFGADAKAAFSVGEARAAAILAAADFGLEAGQYPPRQVKQVVVGVGGAEKAQVTYMVRLQLGLDHDPKPDHCSDALAIALAHALLIRGAGKMAAQRAQRSQDATGAGQLPRPGNDSVGRAEVARLCPEKVTQMAPAKEAAL
ncbi:MAG: crossover junction endodeoxyribonuclease RuvC [Coriobacteriia bacterium]|nr:crossover junction endodeoxyribonuclease RuvC [Coriobacteriia bacterium]